MNTYLQHSLCSTSKYVISLYSIEMMLKMENADNIGIAERYKILE